ncbi:MAG: hypothetical protein LUH07_08765 [Lachnospiraceae bacterium]|nr:hypothetical protein [Lachnospiraceae bacterium]
MSKKVYSKPNFTMMRFTLSDNVATSECDYYSPVTIPCLITGSHTIFYNDCGNGNNYNNLGSSIVKVTSTMYFTSDQQAIEYLKDMLDGTQDRQYQTGSYELKAGEYLVWTAGQTHAAYITGTNVTHGINASA